MSFPSVRLRRLRKNATTRAMVRETHLKLENLIYPIFVRPGKSVKNPIKSMPGIYQFSLDRITDEVSESYDAGIRAFLIFGIPKEKDDIGSEAWDDNGLVQQAIRKIKGKYPDIVMIADACFCEYTSHGHCGVLSEKGRLLNDSTLVNLGKEAISYARAGADMIAPSGMIDGMVKAIRGALDEEGFSETTIMSYSAKYASAFYGPFRDAAESAPQFGDRKSYQMDPANSDEALREIALDAEEGADIIMVKPALSYLDIIAKAKANFNLPLAAYNVSGEYSMIKAAGKAGYIDEKAVRDESLISIKRAGADMIITYFAKEIALEGKIS